MSWLLCSAQPEGISPFPITNFWVPVLQPFLFFSCLIIITSIWLLFQDTVYLIAFVCQRRMRLMVLFFWRCESAHKLHGLSSSGRPQKAQWQVKYLLIARFTSLRRRPGGFYIENMWITLLYKVNFKIYFINIFYIKIINVYLEYIK